MSKLFLTGRPRSGKSSAIQNCLSKYAFPLGGFAVQRLTRQGETWAFRLLDLAEEAYVTHLETDKHFDDIAIYMPEPGKWQGIVAVFNEKGCNALEKCLNTFALVIMDELGIFERDAVKFQASVFNVLDSSRSVLGVVKDKSSPFLDKVRSHPAVTLARFPEENTIQAVNSLLGQVRL